ncbi:MAG TPA: ABC transporter permease [Bacillales bacterium]|nr:ABC transporter permease [Bacillales bacterium]
MGNVVNKGWKNLVPPLMLVFLILIVWELIVRIENIEKWLLPAPSDIAAALMDNAVLLAHHTIPTLWETLAGLVIGTVAALMLAAVIELSPWLRKALYPLLVGTQTVPIVAIAPLFIVWFGYGFLPKMLIVVLVTFFPIVVSVAEGFRSADRDMVRLLLSMGAGRWRVFRSVRFPHAMPYLFSGLKIAATYSVMGAVVAEWLGAQSGLGVFLVRAQHSFAADKVFAAIIVITFWSIVLFLAVQAASRLFAPWIYVDEKSQGRRGSK